MGVRPHLDSHRHQKPCNDPRPHLWNPLKIRVYGVGLRAEGNGKDFRARTGCSFQGFQGPGAALGWRLWSPWNEAKCKQAFGWDFRRLDPAWQGVKGIGRDGRSGLWSWDLRFHWRRQPMPRAVLPPAGYSASCSFLAVVLHPSLASIPQRLPLFRPPPLPSLRDLALTLL